ncbi:MAG: hypothetical protein KIT80_17225 [Chitinophagaceae bacterium]|nr:hypothetical protein [Chitinophagaceae bacterium]MCW5928664.1 hypothetical protein [Chitinophagaceae bacterium]
MKQKISLLLALPAALLILFNSCKKNEDVVINEDTEVSVVTDDEALLSAELESTNFELALLLDESGAVLRNQEEPNYVCGATLAYNAGKVTVNYNGNNCEGSRKRQGKIIVTLPANFDWSKGGAAISLQFDNFKITRLADNKSITINGTQTYTNVSGGWLGNLSEADFIEHKVTSDGLSLTFDNGAVREWKVAKKRTFVKLNQGLVISTEGFHSEGNTQKIGIWGVNRLGFSFATSSVNPVVVKQNCSYRITEGKIKHTVAGISVTATFGLNAEGNPVGCPDGNYYYSLDYTGKNGKTFSFILPY